MPATAATLENWNTADASRFAVEFVLCDANGEARSVRRWGVAALLKRMAEMASQRD